MPRKLSAIRQLSLQADTPPTSASTRRASLKKQQSEELKEDFGIRISLSAKTLRNNKTIKVAWEEDNVKAVRRHSHQFIDEPKEALKLRNTWNDHEVGKGNKLNIFLAQTVSNLDQDVDQDAIPSPRQPPKIILPLHPETESKENVNLKNIFQKHLRKSSKMSSPAGSDNEYTPSNQHQPVVVVPIIERTNIQTPIITHPTSTIIPNSTSMNSPYLNPNHDPIQNLSRPHTAAAQKRAMFQKRTNSAFQTIQNSSACPSPMPTTRSHTFRPPLTRASSLPTNNKPECKLKSFRKKVKIAKRPKTSKDPDEENKKNSDVVTMVSLVSPSESENEDCEAIKEPSVPSPKKSQKIATSPMEEKCFSLRKTVKQVSFQHSSIHAVRSFSASFPARRASVGTNLLLDNAVKKLQKNLEKRGQQDEGLIDAKRRLLRTTMDHGTISKKIIPTQEKVTTNGNEGEVNMSRDGEEIAMTTQEEPSKLQETSGNGTPVVEEVESMKERKCWETYCRMAKSGLNVSYDTILRGMLTPTEYRLRRRFSLQCFTEGNEPTVEPTSEE